MKDSITAIQVIQWFATPGLALALLVFIWNFSSRITSIELKHAGLEKANDEKHTAFDKKIDRICDDLTWYVRNITRDATALQHKPHPEAWRLDGLIEKLHKAWREEVKLPPEDVDLLRALLWEKYNDESVNRSERDGAYLSLRGIEFLYPEHRGPNPIDLRSLSSHQPKEHS